MGRRTKRAGKGKIPLMPRDVHQALEWTGDGTASDGMELDTICLHLLIAICRWVMVHDLRLSTSVNGDMCIHVYEKFFGNDASGILKSFGEECTKMPTRSCSLWLGVSICSHGGGGGVFRSRSNDYVM